MGAQQMRRNGRRATDAAHRVRRDDAGYWHHTDADPPTSFQRSEPCTSAATSSTGRPLGAKRFVVMVEKPLDRVLQPRQRGPKPSRKAQLV